MSSALEQELRSLLNEAMGALWNVQGVLNLIHEEGTMGDVSFNQSIASAIRIMSYQVDATVDSVAPKM